MGRKLLVADDSATIQKVIKLALSSEGYEILAVSEGKEAVRAIDGENPDVVLIDVALPGLDAYAVKKAVKASSAFIMMASAFEKIDEEQFASCGFRSKLIKPFDPSHLRKAVSELMSKSVVSQNTRDSIVPATPDLKDLPPVVDMMPTVRESTKSGVKEFETVQPVGSASFDEATGVLDLAALQASASAIALETDFKAPPAPTLTVDDINSSSTRTSPPPPPRATFPSPGPTISPEQQEFESEVESDIKDLTESTIKLSGLDELQWNLDDSKKMKSKVASAAQMTPRQQETPPLPDFGDRTREVTQSNLHTDRRGSMGITIPARPIDDGGSTFPMHMLKSATSEQKSAPQNVAQSGTTPVGSLISRAEIEEIIRRDMQAAIERLAKDALPQIAESIIRKEIEKILEEK